jgi:hypothetical protein
MGFNSMKQFRDQNPYPVNSKDWVKYENFLENQRKDETVGCPEEIEEHFIDLIKKIDTMELVESCSEDVWQKELLLKRIETAKELLLEITAKVERYIEMMQRLKAIKVNKERVEGAEFKERVGAAETNRSQAHDALIASINAARRFVLNNFGKIDDELIGKWEDGEESAGRPILHAKRITINNNMICSDKVNLDDRARVTDWAEQFYKCMTQLKNRLNDKSE